jgi:hypothetical protein
MKKYLKISCLLFVATLLFTCDDDNKLSSPEENIGWIQFPGANPDVIQVNTELSALFSLGVDVQVPVVDQDFTISYNLVPVSGLDPNTVFNNNGSIISPAGLTSYAGPDNNTGRDYTYLANIDFDLTLVPQLSELMVFDVVLTSASDSNITVGLNGADKPTVQRISILCANPDTIPADYFVGDYVIADGAATIGPGNGTENFEGGTVTLAVDPFNPNVRTFSVAVLPAFVPAQQFTSIEFTQNDDIALGQINSGIGCGGGGGAEYIYTEAGADNSLWSICNDDDVVTINYIEDPLGSCGGPFASSFTLTRL